MQKVFFREEQKFGSISLYISMGLIYLSVLGLLLYALIMQFLLDKQWKEKPISDDGLIILAVLIPLILIVSALLLFGSKLITEVNRQGISYSFQPFIRKPKVITKESIHSFEIREYKPIKEYGGWGVGKTQGHGHRKGKSGIAYNVKGNIGLQLKLTDGKLILIGTQRAEALKRAMIKLMN